VPPLSSRVYQQTALSERPALDGSRVFAVAELTAGGQVFSRNLTYLVPTKQFVLPPAEIESELAPSSSGYRLHLSSKLLARSVYVSFGALDVQLFDIQVQSTVALEALRGGLKVMSLVDAFPPANAAAPAKTN
jgi:beta-mannosidase